MIADFVIPLGNNWSPVVRVTDRDPETDAVVPAEGITDLVIFVSLERGGAPIDGSELELTELVELPGSYGGTKDVSEVNAALEEYEGMIKHVVLVGEGVNYSGTVLISKSARFAR